MKQNTRIVVGMSGGVDSSVSAYLLKEQGYDVQGLFMKNWEEDDTDEYCSASEDVADAQSVCDRLGLALHTANFSAEYWDNVFEHFLAELKAGRTPNPDILCNKEIKFKVFLDYAQHLQAEFIATGHYVRKDYCDGRYRLLRGRDSNKDQSYFLYTIGQEQLARSLFPVGELEKPAVRVLAEQAKLVTHNKKDSTGICFIGERKFADFLKRYFPAQPGQMRTPEGEFVGEHQGLMYYTLGQRQGLGIGGRQGDNGQPWYVLAKDLTCNELIVGQGHDHPLLLADALFASQLHWVNGEAIASEFLCTAKTRYRQMDQSCRVRIASDGRAQVEFEQSQWAMTPGQSVVFYQGDVCLGGGIIESVHSK
ncbi:tRNA-specific 2-thiouridylase MnmA (plasmid) [Piscirickettsia salmonis]|uniref:tRNA-specific 2-thiouridylase MnmA n=2 Tax=Piscirickettsia salmonis TaxID=1238 RepID=A0AAC8VIF2_PISSA|nr:tRNA 2-thiouridine(34) synthase MnmA [Piscirickettsia salmonis]ALB23105.1 tRNA 2-thiouridylase [Piscirickettsia salmonis]QGN98292.1 tRNA-specific 2-thiouridylase MnmA [Piscirickettsia salmonis]QGO00462.1 tRNA-specific 2-thiouridylase MnmA [Piscirickettsia salmonis]QGO01913.1 tRNA-specific 2-thiouridylase MnmA [Piscirickettsia salmonis]QGO12600.1 tRNA-specific 2-thiouridylase MnmA [Piscirickettsia salmonis]